MKHFFLILITFASINFSFGQKFGYVDTEHILSKVKEYRQAQQEIDKMSVQYQKEIEKLQTSADSLRAIYKQEEILLTDEMKKKFLVRIAEADGNVKELQNKVFGFEGRIFLKRQELIKPIQDMVYTAIEKVAKDHKLQVVFDKAGDLVLLYTNPTHDYTDYVLEELKLGDPKDTIDNPR